MFRRKRPRQEVGAEVAQSLIKAFLSGGDVQQAAQAGAQKAQDEAEEEVPFGRFNGPRHRRTTHSSGRVTRTRHTGNATVYSSSCRKTEKKFIAPR